MEGLGLPSRYGREVSVFSRMSHSHLGTTQLHVQWVAGILPWVERSGVYRILVGKPEGRRPLGRPRCRWVDNIRMDLQEVGCGHVDWIGLAQDRDRWRTLVSAVMNLQIP